MTLRIAVGGLIGREHAVRIQASARFELAAVVDPSPAEVAWALARGLVHHSQLDALLSGRRPEAAIVATPNALHVEQTTALLRAGVPVLVGHQRRHSAAIAAAQARIAAGTLGRIVAVSATTLFHKPDAYFDVAWRRGPAGGPILINAVHDVDSLRALVCPVAGEIVAVQAVASNAVRGFEVEDSAAVLLEFARGALGTLMVSDCAVSPWSWEQTSGENPAYARDTTQDNVFIAGTEGSLPVPTLRL